MGDYFMAPCELAAPIRQQGLPPYDVRRRATTARCTKRGGIACPQRFHACSVELIHMEE